MFSNVIAIINNVPLSAQCSRLIGNAKDIHQTRIHKLVQLWDLELRIRKSIYGYRSLCSNRQYIHVCLPVDD